MPKLLVVEDNEMSRTMLVRRLRRRGFESSRRRTAGQQSRRSMLHHPDLVLMDINLPDLDGWAATRTLKSDLSTAATPADRPHRPCDERGPGAALAVGLQRFVTRPIDLRGSRSALIAWR